MKQLYYLPLLFIFSVTTSFAQQPNLVPNPSFEILNGVAPTRYTSKTVHFDSIMQSWSTTNKTSPDILSADLKDITRSYRIPKPKTGEVAVGLINNLGIWTEYINVPLKQSIKKGKTYYAEFWYMVLTPKGEPLSGSRFNPNFGVLFYNQIIVRKKGYLQATPQIASQKTTSCMNYTWQQLSGTFVADQDYSHICLGQFDAQFNGSLNGCIVIDDVIVRETEPALKMEVGETLVLNDVIFKSGTSVLEKSAYPSLKKLRQGLLTNKEIHLAINGHTDNVGSEKDNMALSNSRAKVIYNYLLNEGIEKERLTFSGFGETQPIHSNDSQSGRKKNRRVEFKIVGAQVIK